MPSVEFWDRDNQEIFDSISHWGLFPLSSPISVAYQRGYEDGWERAAYEYETEPNN